MNGLRRVSLRFTVVLLIVIELCSLFLVYKSFSNKNINEIKKENKINKEMFAMYIEDEEGKYSEYTGNTIPEGYTLNFEKSGCVDHANNIVKDILSYANRKITVRSNKSVYCYLYFKQGTYNVIINNVENGTVSYLNSTAVTGDVVELTVTPDAGYKLKSLTYNGIDITNELSFTMPEGNVTVEVEWEAIVYTINVSSSSSAYGVVTPSKTEATVGETITVSVTPATYYKLSSLKANSTDITSSLSFTMPAANVTLTPTYYLYTFAKYLIDTASTDSNLIYHANNCRNGCARDGSYKYSGSNDEVLNNFVCFGSETSPCPAEYLHRVIEVTSDERVIIMKVIPYPVKYAFDNSGSLTFENSDLYDYLNNTVIDSGFYNNGQYLRMIDQYSYYFAGGVSTSSLSATYTAYNYFVVGRNTIVYNLMGIMSVSNYAYSAPEECWKTAVSSYSGDCANTWIANAAYTAWMLNANEETGKIFYLSSTGTLSEDLPTASHYFFPVIQIKSSNVIVTSGDGTRNNTYYLGYK